MNFWVQIVLLQDTMGPILAIHVSKPTELYLYFILLWQLCENMNVRIGQKNNV